MTRTAGYLPGQMPGTRGAEVERAASSFPRCNPRLLKEGETGTDELGNRCIGRGDGQYDVIVVDNAAQSKARDIVRRETTSGGTDARAHDRQHSITSADDHTNLGVSGERSDGLTTVSGIVTVLGTASSTPSSSLWARDGNNDLVATGFLRGATGVWALELASMDLAPWGESLWPDTCWDVDGNGDVQPKAV